MYLGVMLISCFRSMAGLMFIMRLGSWLELFCSRSIPLDHPRFPVESWEASRTGGSKVSTIGPFLSAITWAVHGRCSSQPPRPVELPHGHGPGRRLPAPGLSPSDWESLNLMTRMSQPALNDLKRGYVAARMRKRPGILLERMVKNTVKICIFIVVAL